MAIFYRNYAGCVAPVYNPRTLETGAVGSPRVQGEPVLQSDFKAWNA